MALYICDWCGTPHRYPISAAMCCDSVSNEWVDLDLDGSTIERGND